MRLRHPDDIQALLRAARLLAVVEAWSDTGCFEALRGGPRPIAELPGDARAVALTAPLLAHAGLLDGGAIGGHHHAWLRDLAGMSDILRTGRPAVRTDGGVQRDDLGATRSFLDMLWRGAADASALTAEWVQRRVPAGARVLDLGGGHGRYGRALADAGYRVTLFDVPQVVPLARERHGGALAYLEGDFLRDPLGGPYDLVLMSNIAHGLSDVENRSLLRRLREVVAPGGQLLVKDMFLDDLGTGPEESVQFNLTMLLYTDAGRCHTVAEYGGWCRDAGFHRWDRVVAPHHTLLFVGG